MDFWSKEGLVLRFIRTWLLLTLPAFLIVMILIAAVLRLASSPNDYPLDDGWGFGFMNLACQSFGMAIYLIIIQLWVVKRSLGRLDEGVTRPDKRISDVHEMDLGSFRRILGRTLEKMNGQEHRVMLSKIKYGVSVVESDETSIRVKLIGKRTVFGGMKPLGEISFHLDELGPSRTRVTIHTSNQMPVWYPSNILWDVYALKILKDKLDIAVAGAKRHGLEAALA